METKHVVTGIEPKEHAENVAARLAALGCSAEHVAAAKLDIQNRTVRRGTPGDPQLRGAS